MVRVRYVGTVRWYGTLVRCGSRCEVGRTQILNVPYRTAILAEDTIERSKNGQNKDFFGTKLKYFFIKTILHYLLLFCCVGGNHVVPSSIIQLAIRVCRMYGEERDHEDIDKDESLLQIPDQSWNDLISHYTKLVQ